MRTYEDFMSIEGKVFGLKNITKDLYLSREEFCSKLCIKCPIWKMFYSKGYSCNTALNTFPLECMEIFKN